MPTAPTGSSLGRCVGSCLGSQRAASTTAARPIGTLMKKMVRQPQPKRFASSSTPPSTWPATAPRPMVAPKADIALARSSTGNIVLIRARTCGTISAAVAPCRMRKATSAQPFGAMPHSSEATANRAMPRTNRRRWPYRSPRRPPVIRPLA